MNNFTDEEIKMASQVKKLVMEEKAAELKALYMAGEINMWQELEKEREKAAKWDALQKRIDSCYGKEDKDGQWREYSDEESSEMGNDLGKIGEYAAMAYGYL